MWFNRHELRWRLIGWFALSAVPLAVAGGVLLAHTPLKPLTRLLGLFLIGVVIWRRRNPIPADRPTRVSPQSELPPAWAQPSSAQSAR
jgi:uncharacterized membrane protein YfcA